MKKAVSIFVFIITVLCGLLGIASNTPAYAQLPHLNPGITTTFNPLTNSGIYYVNQSFTVDAVVNAGSTAIERGVVNIVYTDSIINFEGIKMVGNNPSLTYAVAPHLTTYTFPGPDGQAKVKVIAFEFIKPQGISGTFSLGTITLRGNKPGTVGLSYVNTQFYTVGATTSFTPNSNSGSYVVSALPKVPSPCKGLGDVNLDGTVTEADASVVTLSLGANARTSLSTEQKRVADVDGVAGVDANDAALISQFAAKKITTFPACSLLPTPTLPVYCEKGADKVGLDQTGCTPGTYKIVNVTCFDGFSQIVQSPTCVDSKAANVLAAKACIGHDHCFTPEGTITPTSVPGTSTTPPSGACPLKPKGDADCNGKVDIQDFLIWKYEFLNKTPHSGASSYKSNFNGSTGNPTINNFLLWKAGFLDPSIVH